MEAVKNIRRLAIANRGEVAVRIIRACEEMGIETVLLHSKADVQSRAYRMATKRVCIGESPSSDSYLNIEANVKAAISAQAQAVHPGFGFLSENPHFVRACQKSGLIFVGPSAESMQALGDKISCKELAQKNGLPLVPGFQSESAKPENLYPEALRIGLPVIVKAAAGGGGRGMKLLKQGDSPEVHMELIESAQREALAAFGSERIFLEKYLDHAKHIELQIFVDHKGVVHSLEERECSVQRRHQKIIEEARSPLLTQDLRKQMSECARKLVGSTGYRGAATVEFLLQDEKFYLLEVNTRLQVEHPVTEMVMGVDLVKAQILTAAGMDLAWPKVLSAQGHSIECRIYAEDPYQRGLPSIGKLGWIQWPEGPGRRFEYGFEANDTITSYYDPMIAKVIVWDETRPRAIQKMKQVLMDSVVFGVQTNIPYLQNILSHPEFVHGKMTTRFIDQYFADHEMQLNLTNLEKSLIEKIQQSTPRPETLTTAAIDLKSPFVGSWSRSSGSFS